MVGLATGAMGLCCEIFAHSYFIVLRNALILPSPGWSEHAEIFGDLAYAFCDACVLRSGEPDPGARGRSWTHDPRQAPASCG